MSYLKNLLTRWPKQLILAVVSVFLLGAGLGLAQVWTAPTADPPNGNTPPPINESGTSQTKIGVLSVNGFNSYGLSLFGGLSTGSGFFIRQTGTAISFNRNPNDGTMKSTAGHGYQLNHFLSTTPANDYLSWQVYRPDGTNVAVGTLTINGQGNVGVGTNNPAAQLHTTGTVRFSGVGAALENSINTRIATLDSSGNVTWRNPGSWTGGVGSGVSKIIAGNNITISPTTGVGEVTINATTGGGGITRLDQGNGITLTPNPITTTGTVAANLSQIFAGANCPSGQAINTIGSTGSASCIDVGGTGTGDITGSGTQHRVAKFTTTDGKTIGNSQIIDNGTYVGIGVVNPEQARLEVLGFVTGPNVFIPGIKGRGEVAVVGDGSIIGLRGANNNSTGMAIVADQLNSSGYALYSTGGRNYFQGNVGIGTASPGDILHILRNGSAGTTGGLFVETSGTAGAGNQATVALGDSATKRFILAYNRDGSGSAEIRLNTNSPLRFYTNNLERMVINSSGNVGIGTASPTTKLDVRGQASFLGPRIAVGDGVTMPVNNTGSPGLWVSSDGNSATSQFIGQVNGNKSVAGIWNGLWGIQVAPNGSVILPSLPQGNNISHVRFLAADTSGNVTWRNVSEITGSGGGLPTGSSGQTLRHDGANWVANSNIFNNGTNVGIGTSNPTTKLTVSGSLGAGSLFVTGSSNLSGAVNVGATGAAGKINFARASDGATWSAFYGFPDPNNSAEIRAHSSGGGQFFTWYTNVGGVAAERMRLSNAGNLGIGTNNPDAKLDVTGNIRIADGTQGANKILASDASGLASWKTANELNLGGGLPTGLTNGEMLRWNSTTSSWVTTNNIVNNGSFTTIGGPVVQDDTTVLGVTGRVQIRGGNPDLNKILVSSNTSGDAEWKTASELGLDGGGGGSSAVTRSSVTGGVFSASDGSGGGTVAFVSKTTTCNIGETAVGGGAKVEISLNNISLGEKAIFTSSRPDSSNSRNWTCTIPRQYLPGGNFAGSTQTYNYTLTCYAQCASN